MRHFLGRHERLMRRRDYVAVYDAKRSAADARLIVYVRPNDLTYTRIGRSVSGKWGNAVCRNRFRRRVLEAFRLNREAMPKGLDIIVLPRRTIDLELVEIAQSLIALTVKASSQRTGGQ